MREIYYYENGKYYDIRGKGIDILQKSDGEVANPQLEYRAFYIPSINEHQQYNYSKNSFYLC